MDCKTHLVWIVMISLTTSRSSQHRIHTDPLCDHDPTDTDTSAYQNSQQHYTPRSIQRMNERSIPFNSGIQKVQEAERRRYNPTEDRIPRIENGTYKVINNFSTVPLASRRGPVNEQSTSPDVVVFPGPTSRSSFIPKIPEECLRTGICEDVPDYPEDHVANIINSVTTDYIERQESGGGCAAMEGQIFNAIKVQQLRVARRASLGEAKDKYKVDELDTPEIAQRIGPPEEMELCDFALKVVIPKAAPDKDGNWHYIINQKDKPLQGFHVEICREDRSPCAKLAHFYSGYEANCKQKYVLRYMAGLNENGEMVDKPFKLPSCCSCVVRQKD